jgi:hypothetical protein
MRKALAWVYLLVIGGILVFAVVSMIRGPEPKKPTPLHSIGECGECNISDNECVSGLHCRPFLLTGGGSRNFCASESTDTCSTTVTVPRRR